MGGGHDETVAIGIDDVHFRRCTIFRARQCVAIYDPVEGGWNPKFARLGGPGDIIDTELHGTVKWITGTTLWISPDVGYDHLLITGNSIKPPPGEYDANSLPGLDVNFAPMLKLETYGVGARPESNPSGAPINVQLMDGTFRLLQVGDHVSVTGLWVIDYDHTMYTSAVTCTSAFAYFRGTYQACHAHTELHPYNVNSLKIIPTLAPVGSTVTESHLVAAPFYEDIYSHTYAWNQVNGIAGWRVGESIWNDWTKSSLVVPPRQALGRADCRVQTSLTTAGTSGSASWTYNQDQSVNLHMTVSGTDAVVPSVFVSTVNLSVKDCSGGGCSCLPPPNCIDTPGTSQFCGAPPVNCSGRCYIAPSEPGIRSCVAPSPGLDPVCRCN